MELDVGNDFAEFARPSSFGVAPGAVSRARKGGDTPNASSKFDFAVDGGDHLSSASRTLRLRSHERRHDARILSLKLGVQCFRSQARRHQPGKTPSGVGPGRCSREMPGARSGDEELAPRNGSLAGLSRHSVTPGTPGSCPEGVHFALERRWPRRDRVRGAQTSNRR